MSLKPDGDAYFFFSLFFSLLFSFGRKITPIYPVKPNRVLNFTSEIDQKPLPANVLLLYLYQLAAPRACRKKNIVDNFKLWWLTQAHDTEEELQLKFTSTIKYVIAVGWAANRKKVFDEKNRNNFESKGDVSDVFFYNFFPCPVI